MFNRIKSALEARARREDSEKGFTLIELLVVVLIIGILSAIAVPIFLGQQNQAKDAAAKSDLANAKTAMISAATAANGVYPVTGADPVTALGDYGYTASPNLNTPVAITLGGASFCLQATSGLDSRLPHHVEFGRADGTLLGHSFTCGCGLGLPGLHTRTAFYREGPI